MQCAPYPFSTPTSTSTVVSGATPSEENQVVFVSSSVNDDDMGELSSSKVASLSRMKLKSFTIFNTTKVPLYNDVQMSSKTRLPRTWKVHANSDKKVRREDVDANTCFEKRSFFSLGKNVRCLPSLYVIGFEKAGTTILNIWLSHHPSLETRWMEGRFFDINPRETLQNIDSIWHDYLRTLPSIPFEQIGRTWTMEKSPAYAHNPYAPLALSALVPSAKLLLVTRNPTQRAYSMFQMYTKHYPDAASAILGRPKSYFVKNVVTGDVRYIGDNFRDLHPSGKKTNRLPPGRGGSLVPSSIAPPSSSTESNVKTQEWYYVDYPPNPIDFDRYIQYAVSKYNEENKNVEENDTFLSAEFARREHPVSSLPFLRKMNGRGERILTAGLYGPYVEQWLTHFPPHSMIMIPSEDFFAPDKAVRSMANLQEVLGLPFIDYENLLSKDPQSGRVELSSSFGTFLNHQFNSNNHITRLWGVKDENRTLTPSPMLPETKKLLDEFYCNSNRQLKRLMGENQYLLTQMGSYACYDS
eukprot:jgi/Psemu1/326787/estExt_fgenesh1_pg.C_4690003